MSEDSLNLVLQKNNQTKPHQAWQKSNKVFITDYYSIFYR